MEGFQEELVCALRDVVSGSNWQCVGEKEKSRLGCTKLYSEDGEHIVLIHLEGDGFYAMGSACPHEGGPLELGDIEDLGNGNIVLSCPWHDFEFSLIDGSSSSDLQNQVYEVKVLDGKVYVRTQSTLSRSPFKTSNLPQCVTDTPSESSQSCSSDSTLCYWAAKILCTPDPEEKATLTHQVQEFWDAGKITEIGQITPPAHPSRQADLNVVQPGRIKRGKGGMMASRIALLHSLANIKQSAIDLSWDIIVHFATFRLQNGKRLPREFFTDFVKVAVDAAEHFKLLQKRLLELGSFFGALPVHNGLWQSAADTAHDLLARLAIVHMVQEARGLDLHPQTLNRFAMQADEASVKLLEPIYRDEITHVAFGLKWFTYVCSKEDRDCLSTFLELVPKYFRGNLKPPFSAAGRQCAEMTEEWFLSLVKPARKMKLGNEDSATTECEQRD
ncbi:uncharacterized protein LOC115075330 [Rhinatrema bivittatum]|uniref:uncharacterized protein LOC115075330 n=1 Tax=Rhinatrema bivittatum TaxID=194408 RepID=UPI001128D0F8|nr:uncharacterized protein LOC115075330 [Rhinatrema bivittatum]